MLILEFHSLNILTVFFDLDVFNYLGTLNTPITFTEA